MKIKEDLDRLQYVVEFRHMGFSNWHKCCSSSFGTVEYAKEHIDNVMSIDDMYEYRIKGIAEFIHSTVTTVKLLSEDEIDALLGDSNG